jgi:hypothetical protein
VSRNLSWGGRGGNLDVLFFGGRRRWALRLYDRRAQKDAERER